MPTSEVHLWWERFDRRTDARLDRIAAALLPSDERSACDRFVFEEGRRECLAARCMVRLLLSRYRDVSPGDWRFSPDEHGRPAIAQPAEAGPLRFNLSHAAGLVTCALAEAREVGVDVEHVARRTPLALADSHFAPSERAALEALPPADRPRRFLEYWTLKEAYIKARGAGLSLALDRFAFDVDTPGMPAIHFEPAFDDVPARWQFDRASLGDHLAAVATQVAPSERITLVTRRFDLATWPA